MDVVKLFRVEGSFPMAYAIVTIHSDEKPATGECFLLVENRRPFLGFRRMSLSGYSHEKADEAAMAEVRRIHLKMRDAAERYGLLPPGTSRRDTAELRPSTPADLETVIGEHDFSDHIVWISENTVSPSLRAWLRDLARIGVSDVLA
jgi:hypothetical protein